MFARAGPWGRAAMVALLAISAAASARAKTELETAIEATYLYKFAPFVDWPDAAAAGPLTLCVAGPDPFGADLDRAVAHQTVGERRIVVRRLDAQKKVAGCHILYASGPAAQVADVLKAARPLPVLTVTDGLGSGGMIQFVVRDQRVRFAIDDQAAADAGLTISSKLLSLAVDVRTRTAKATER